ncbi:hypothetical protein BCR32DRAFT_327755 [Anaeromyces robustus]|uniref:Phospholipid scramblase n=1 Tax=Anaeromyces robustus TaxID=1754192 RepID=A0A1Y1X370_9FUNG|nr:hypothetical protein BCR32DRAFT_327755 [Anaeromyces robustus]|eukprot:ORX80259.1 hypothetical protein BCR32DRAFT_327755 [Anaeromyces robustus]
MTRLLNPPPPQPYTPVSSSEQLPQYTPGYTESPFDINTKIQYNDFINIPDHEIAIIDRKYVTNKHIIYYLREGLKTYNRITYNYDESDTIDILDSEEQKQFYCKKKGKGNKIIIYDDEYTPVLNVNVEMKNYKEIYICKDTSNSELYATIKTSSKVTDDIRNYSISVFNKANNEEEELEMKYNKFRNYYTIYCNNKGKDKKIMIGTIKKIGKDRKKFSVEIAPMVDFMFLLGLGTLVIRLEAIKKKIHEDRMDYFNFIVYGFCIIS